MAGLMNKNVIVIYQGQVVNAVVLYKFLWWYRIYMITTNDKYILGWTSKRKIIQGL